MKANNFATSPDESIMDCSLLNVNVLNVFTKKHCDKIKYLNSVSTFRCCSTVEDCAVEELNNRL